MGPRALRVGAGGKHREEKRADLMPIDLAAAVVGWLAGSDFGDAGIFLVCGSRCERELKKAVAQAIKTVGDQAGPASRQALS